VGDPGRRARARPAAGTVNAELPTGEVELFAAEIEVLSAAELPCSVSEASTVSALTIAIRWTLRREEAPAR